MTAHTLAYTLRERRQELKQAEEDLHNEEFATRKLYACRDSGGPNSRGRNISL